MQKAMTIAYAVGKNLYLNITNRCPCACTFCIRTMCDGAYGSDPLWLDHEPSMEEIREALDKEDLSHYQEVVFCGFGEPTERLETLCETAKLLKARGVKTIRINTNGLSDLIHGRKTAADLKGLVDILPKPELEAAQQLADRLGIHLRIRQFDDAATRRNG